MNILAVDTATRSCSVALAMNGVVKSELTLQLDQTHSRHLTAMVETVIKIVEVNLHQVDAYAAVTGPGSFTGLRIGLAAVKGYALAFGKPVAGVSSLEALALPFSGEGLICSMIDARKGEVYAELYRWERDGLVIVHPACVVLPGDLIRIVGEMGSPCRFVGSGARLCRDLIVDSLGTAACFAPASMNHVRAGAVAELAYDQMEKGRMSAAADIAPVYIRRSDAERKKDKKAM